MLLPDLKLIENVRTDAHSAFILCVRTRSNICLWLRNFVSGCTPSGSSCEPDGATSGCWTRVQRPEKWLCDRGLASPDLAYV
jgi:hypothetical protein